VVHQTDAKGLLCIDHARREQQVHGSAVANNSGQHPGDAVFGDQSAPREGSRESCCLAGKSDITVERFDHAQPRCHAVDRRDDRLANGQREVPRARPDQVLGRYVGDLHQVAQVRAGTKSATGAGDHDDTHLWIVVAILEQVEIPVLELVAPGVELARPIEGQDQHRSGPFSQHQVRAGAGIGHRDPSGSAA
jgi:hypothetical protein